MREFSIKKTQYAPGPIGVIWKNACNLSKTKASETETEKHIMQQKATTP